MENLYELAVQIQSQLTPANQYEEHLIEVLCVAIQEQPFYTFVETAKPTSSVREYVKQEHLDRQRVVKSLITEMDNSTYNTTAAAASPSQEITYISTAKRNLTEALYAKAGRRYAQITV